MKISIKISILLMVCRSSLGDILAQNTLEVCNNLPRHGDRLVKQQIAYEKPGSGGENIIWDFRDIIPVDEYYNLNYNVEGMHSDTIVGTENRTMYYYKLYSDSLLLLGYENPTTLLNYSKPELLLVFPFFYGCVLTDYFDGKGKYCNRLNVHICGKSTVTADATGGLLLPGGDTLRNVMRIHVQKRMVESIVPVMDRYSLQKDSISFDLKCDSIDFRLQKASTFLKIDTWYWYAEGYRYPVFETVKSTIFRNGKWSDHFLTSFYYPPHEQYYTLKNDPDNQVMRTKTNEKEYNGRENTDMQSYDCYKDTHITYNYGINNLGQLLVDCKKKKKAEVYLIIYDMQGRQLSQQYSLYKKDEKQCSIIPMNDYPVGEYLLRIQVNNLVYGNKILKR